MKHDALQDIAVGKLQATEQKPAWFKVSRHKELRYLYSSDFVLKRLKWAACNPNPNTFARFHVDEINKALRLGADRVFEIGCNTEEFDEMGNIRNIQTFQNNSVGTELMDRYRLSSLGVDFSKTARLQQPGRAIFCSDFMERQEFKRSSAYNEIYSASGASDFNSISYRLPFKAGFQINNVLLSSSRVDLKSVVKRHDIEYANIPFLFGWLLQLGQITLQNYETWMGLLVGLSPIKLAILRELVNVRQFYTHAVALKYEMSKRTLETHLHMIYEQAFSILGFTTDPRFRSARLVDICNHFYFLKYCGRVQNEYDFRATLISQLDQHCL
jgi:hypothetical protein